MHFKSRITLSCYYECFCIKNNPFFGLMLMQHPLVHERMQMLQAHTGARAYVHQFCASSEAAHNTCCSVLLSAGNLQVPALSICFANIYCACVCVHNISINMSTDPVPYLRYYLFGCTCSERGAITKTQG